MSTIMPTTIHSERHERLSSQCGNYAKLRPGRSPIPSDDLAKKQVDLMLPFPSGMPARRTPSAISPIAAHVYIDRSPTGRKTCLEVVSEPSSNDDEAGELREAMKEGCMALVSCNKVSEGMQPSDCALNDPAFAITAQGATILGSLPHPLATVRTDQRTSSPAAAPDFPSSSSRTP
jgi:hypothetical protein